MVLPVQVNDMTGTCCHAGSTVSESDCTTATLHSHPKIACASKYPCCKQDQTLISRSFADAGTSCTSFQHVILFS